MPCPHMIQHQRYCGYTRQLCAVRNIRADYGAYAVNIQYLNVYQRFNDCQHIKFLFCGRARHIYSIYIVDNGISHCYPACILLIPLIFQMRKPKDFFVIMRRST